MPRVKMRIFLAAVFISFIIVSGGFSFPPRLAKNNKAFGNAENHESMIPVRVLRRIKLPPNGYHEGLLVSGDKIWVNNGEGKNVWVMDIASGKKVSEITPIGTFSEGITHAPGGKYWITDWNTKKLYLVRVEKNKMLPEAEISLAPSCPAGVIWNGSHLFVITWERGLGTKYYLVKMDREGNTLNKSRIMNIPEPTQIAWDEKDLWISSWFNRKVYKIDAETLEIKGYFRSGIEMTTGIAWDGKYFWLTGTKSDLYQMEISPKAE